MSQFFTDCPEDYEMSDSVRMVSIDGLAKEMGMAPEKVIVKIDIEGNEVDAIKGMKGLLESCRGYLIFCEYSVKRMNIAGN